MSTQPNEFPPDPETSTQREGTGFSTYIQEPQNEGALAPEAPAAALPHPQRLDERIDEASSLCESHPPESGHDFSRANQAPEEFGALAPDSAQSALFESFTHAEPAPPARIPHLGHLALLALIAFLGLLIAGGIGQLAVHYHLLGVSDVQEAATEIHYTLGSEAILYLVTLAGCLLIFPFIWHRSFFAGVSWNAATALRLSPMLAGAAFTCFLLALLNGWLMPGPDDAPIDKMFRAPGAAWLLFGFGVTLAPFFEELAFRGFLLPSLATACDWTAEHLLNKPRLLPLTDGSPRWSLPAMVIASILTSIPFAGMHAAQTGYSLGPFLLLICVSLVLCAARLLTRSLAASVTVHACYNFMLFSLMLLGTGGFKHLENM
jgi:uncharacterized protein